MRLFIYIFCLICAKQSLLSAQQLPVLNHYIYNPNLYNPARTGQNEQGSISLNLKRQWVNLPNAPVTGYLNMETPLPNNRLGVGALIYSDRAHLTNRVGGLLTCAYHLPLSMEYKHQLSGGLSLGGVNQRILLSEALVENPEDPYLANGSANGTSFDLSWGLNYQFKGLQVGLSMLQALNNPLKYLSIDPSGAVRSTNTRHLLASVNYAHRFGDFGLSPTVLARVVKNLPLQIEGSLVADWKKILFLGVGYRSSNSSMFSSAIIPTLGVNIKEKVFFGYTIDLGMGSGISAQLGTQHELIAIFKFGASPKTPFDIADNQKQSEQRAADSARVAADSAQLAADSVKFAELQKRVEAIHNQNQYILDKSGMTGTERMIWLNFAESRLDSFKKDLQKLKGDSSLAANNPATPSVQKQLDEANDRIDSLLKDMKLLPNERQLWLNYAESRLDTLGKRMKKIENEQAEALMGAGGADPRVDSILEKINLLPNERQLWLNYAESRLDTLNKRMKKVENEQANELIEGKTPADSDAVAALRKEVEAIRNQNQYILDKSGMTGTERMIWLNFAESRLDSFKRKLEKIETNPNTGETASRTEMDALKKQIQDLERNMPLNIGSPSGKQPKNSALEKRIENTDQRLDSLNQKIQLMPNERMLWVNYAESRLDTLNKKLARTQQELYELKENPNASTTSTNADLEKLLAEQKALNEQLLQTLDAQQRSLNEVRIKLNMQSSEFKKLGEVEFPMGTELSNLAKSQLDALKTELLKRPKAAIYIYGHASTDGDFEKNQQIAYTRAANVRKYLTSKGIDASKMEIVPLGEYKTLSGTDKSNMKDRRAEIFIRE